ALRRRRQPFSCSARAAFLRPPRGLRRAAGRRRSTASSAMRLMSVRRHTRRKAPVTIPELVAEINPVLRGWGLYYHRAHVRKLFAQLDRWVLRRIWAQRFKRWRCRGWKQLPERHLYGELGLVRLVALIPSIRLLPLYLSGSLIKASRRQAVVSPPVVEPRL